MFTPNVMEIQPIGLLTFHKDQGGLCEKPLSSTKDFNSKIISFLNIVHFLTKCSCYLSAYVLFFSGQHIEYGRNMSDSYEMGYYQLYRCINQALIAVILDV